MGGATFESQGQGATVQEAFRAAREQALYDFGHAGYTGTLAEKDDWVVIPVPLGTPDLSRAMEEANALIAADDPRINDKWGPAGAIEYDDPKDGKGWLFFGWASS